MKKFFPFCFLFFIIPLIPYAQFDNNWEQKVDPIVLKKSKSETNTEFIIVMEEQAELSKTNTLKTKEEKGLFVYKTLVEIATRTQKEVIQILRNKNALFQSYWVANVIWVNGDISIIQEIAPLSAVKEIIENISYDQCAKYIRNKISSTHCTLETDLAVQSKCQDQAEYIRYDSCHDGQLKGKQIGTANTAVCKKILIVSKSYPVIASIAFKVRKAVDHTLDQRQCVKAEK